MNVNYNDDDEENPYEKPQAKPLAKPLAKPIAPQPNPIIQSPTRSDTKGFMVLFRQRSGSTWLTKVLLDTHPDIECQGELLASGRYSEQNSYMWMNRFLNGLKKKDKNHRGPFGFKASPGQLFTDKASFYPLLDVIKERQMKIIHLRRRNIVKAAIASIRGSMLSDKCGTAHSHPNASCQLGSVNISPPEFVSNVEKRQRNEDISTALVSFLNVPSIVVDYEDLMESDEPLKDIFRFLGVSEVFNQEDTNLEFIKTTSSDLKAVVPNLNALADALKKKEDARYLFRNALYERRKF